MPYCFNSECWRFSGGVPCDCNRSFCYLCYKSHACNASDESSSRASSKFSASSSLSHAFLTSLPYPVFAIDTHIHLASEWREGEGGLPNEFLLSGACRELSLRITGQYVEPFAWDLDEYQKCTKDIPFIEIKGAVFVECLNCSAVQEARWTFKMCEEKGNHGLLKGVIAHIPVPAGREAVHNFLNELRDSEGKLTHFLKGGRVVLLDEPMPPPNACLEPLYLEGLQALAEEKSVRLLWEWCCVPKALPFIAQVCKKFSSTTSSASQLVFVLNHLGHNDGGDDLEEWQKSIALLAENKNVYAKLGAIEEWGVKDPAPYLDFAIQTFGYERCMYESNWFVSAAAGVRYERTAELILQSLERLGASRLQVQQVFYENACHVYSLE